MKNVQLNELYKCLDAERLLKTKLVTLARPHHSPLHPFANENKAKADKWPAEKLLKLKRLL